MIRPSGSKLLVTERGRFEARSTLIDIGGIYAQRGWERLARIAHVGMARSGILFHTAPGPSMFWDGAEIRQDQVVVVKSGLGHVSRLAGPTSWGAMTLTDEDMQAVNATWPDSILSSEGGCLVVTPPPVALARLRLLHACAGQVADTNQAFALWLEDALTQAMAAVIGINAIHSDSMARQHHQMIVRRFQELLEAQPAGPFHMQEISGAIGVSSRTLRMACQTQLGVSPTQYLLLRRMGMARRALREADPGVTRVTDVATEFGFLELGRFAVKYRQIFGETPSSTLKAAAVLRPESMQAAYALA
jgi:AraC-like DNA-binding protein